MGTRSPSVALAMIVLLGATAAADTKTLMHYVSAPLIEGAGAYAAIACLLDNNAGGNTTAAAYTNLGFLAIEGTLGVVTAFLDGDGRRRMRTVHRVMGFAITAAALWLGSAASIDGIAPHVQVVSYSYAALSTVPIILFSF